jgi:hypothetical protein
MDLVISVAFDALSKLVNEEHRDSVEHPLVHQYKQYHHTQKFHVAGFAVLIKEARLRRLPC